MKFIAAISAFVVFCAHYVNAQTRKPLDDYIAKPDPEYGYTKINEHVADGATIYVFNMTSQRWLSANESSRPVWWHYLSVVIPDNYNPTYQNYSILHIGSDSNEDEEPDPELNFIFDYMVGFSADMGIVSAYIQQVPNQPIIFPDDPDERVRSEDAIIGYTWRRYMVELNTTHPEALMLFPMVKSVTRAMDTVQAVVKTLSPGVSVEKFLLNGASKRGWASWLGGAVDSRVFAIAPMVFSILNMHPNLHQHYRALGGWTFALRPYHEQNITIMLDTSEAKASFNHLDPWEYRDRLTIPKLLVSASGDEFFLNQDSHVWFKNMTNPMYFMMLDNAGHEMAPQYDRIFANVRAMMKSTILNTKVPSVDWQRSQTATGAKFRFTADTTPTGIRAWASNTSDAVRRDWRTMRLNDLGETDFNDVDWYEGPVNDLGNNIYEVEYAKLSDGRWVSFYVEADFAGPDGESFTFTSEVNICPDTFPFPDCSGASCLGTLV